jgi:hypothetical protein
MVFLNMIVGFYNSEKIAETCRSSSYFRYAVE